MNFGDFAKSKKKPKRGQKRTGRGQEEARKRPEEARKMPRTGQKWLGRSQKRPQKARNPEFGEKLFETQCFMNRK